MTLCRFLVCESKHGVSRFVTVTEIVAATLQVVTRGVETWVCPTHSRALDDAEAAGAQVNHTCEGWIYLERTVVAPLFTVWG